MILRDVPLDWTPKEVRLLLMSDLARWQLCARDIEAARRLLPDLTRSARPRRCARSCEERAAVELCRWVPAGGPARAAMMELIDEG